MKVTLQTIARASNLSPSTASRALNGHPAISPATVAKVRQVADKMNYRRVHSHRKRELMDALAGKNIAIISVGIHRSLASLPVVASAINGAEAALSSAAASVRLAHVPDLDDVPGGLRLDKLDGLILSGPIEGRCLAECQSKFLDSLRRLPSVWIIGRPFGCWGDVVGANDYDVGALAAEYLIARGHRRLSFINPKPEHLLFCRREDGFLAAARRAGAEVGRFCKAPPSGWSLPLHPPENVEVVQSLVDQLLAAVPRPTAIFAAADSVAALVYRALAARDLRVGHDISLISGNNDRALIAGLHPHLTTFDIHADQIGRMAVQQLAMRLSVRDPQPDVEVFIPITLVEGESVSSICSCSKGGHR